MRALLATALLVSGCNDITLVPIGSPKSGVSPGEIHGRLCNVDGRSWLADAVVYTNIIDADGKLTDTVTSYTDIDGNWELTDLPGDVTYTVYFQHGDDSIDPVDVYLPPGESVKLEEPACFDPLDLDVAVITGEYDDFELVLANMGFANYTLVDGLDLDELSDFLLDSEEMSRYDVVFIDGGALEQGVLYDAEAGLTSGVVQNLRDFVTNGGQIYVSDWAYDYVESAWPDAIDFVGDDGEVDAAQVGEYGTVNAAVADASMADWLGEDHVDIDYDLPVWPPVESAGPASSIHLTGSVEYRTGTSVTTLPNVPLLASFSSGQGRVVYSSFRVATNASTDMMLVLQYMLYEL